MPNATLRRPRAVAVVAVALLLAGATLAGCSDGGGADAAEEDPPTLGACRLLDPADVAKASNTSPTVPCTEPHTAETYAVGQVPDALTDVEYDDDGLGAWAYDKCSTTFMDFLGADESLVMRTVVSWAWFRPSKVAWDDGARWYRCDVVGGGEQSKEYVDLPTTAKGLLTGLPSDRWMVCADGATVSGSVKVPCLSPHSWRAVSTIKLGDDDADYPGDKVVEAKTRDFCSDQVGAYLGYPVDYDFGYTWFHEAEWQAGNRRSVCWAKTEQ